VLVLLSSFDNDHTGFKVTLFFCLLNNVFDNPVLDAYGGVEKFGFTKDIIPDNMVFRRTNGVMPTASNTESMSITGCIG
jgi:hypothetical protein